MKIKFRPHNFLCALGFIGEGYSPEFIANFTAIMAILTSAGGDETKITIVNEADSICAPCPHRRGKSCASQELITQLDQDYGKTLNMNSGDVISWGEAKQRIKTHVSLDKFHSICASCEWKKLGVCEKALRELT